MSNKLVIVYAMLLALFACQSPKPTTEVLRYKLVKIVEVPVNDERGDVMTQPSIVSTTWMYVIHKNVFYFCALTSNGELPVNWDLDWQQSTVDPAISIVDPVIATKEVLQVETSKISLLSR